MKNVITIVLAAVIAAGLAGVGVYFWQTRQNQQLFNQQVVESQRLKSESDAGITALENQISELKGQNEDLQKTLIEEATLRIQQGAVSDETKDWKIYENGNDCYFIKYPDSYNVWLGNNLVNYDGNDPKYEGGNPLGVKIQIQKHSLVDQENLKGWIEKINKSIQEGILAGNAMETLIERYVLGPIEFYNETLSGPGGAFDNFYIPSIDGKDYYSILVWSMKNDEENVKNILASFLSLTCNN